mmetsp:Transcript_83001/g.146637  ORF Transcript_83001/g.146637 Transcript_83001/m.146637 type:complete len:206 (-) Transcript_83001:1110-1727(-)
MHWRTTPRKTLHIPPELTLQAQLNSNSRYPTGSGPGCSCLAWCQCLPSAGSSRRSDWRGCPNKCRRLLARNLAWSLRRLALMVSWLFYSHRPWHSHHLCLLGVWITSLLSRKAAGLHSTTCVTSAPKARSSVTLQNLRVIASALMIEPLLNSLCGWPEAIEGPVKGLWWRRCFTRKERLQILMLLGICSRQSIARVPAQNTSHQV